MRPRVTSARLSATGLVAYCAAALIPVLLWACGLERTGQLVATITGLVAAGLLVFSCTRRSQLCRRGLSSLLFRFTRRAWRHRSLALLSMLLCLAGWIISRYVTVGLGSHWCRINIELSGEYCVLRDSPRIGSLARELPRLLPGSR